MYIFKILGSLPSEHARRREATSGERGFDAWLQGLELVLVVGVGWLVRNEMSRKDVVFRWLRIVYVPRGVIT